MEEVETVLLEAVEEGWVDCPLLIHSVLVSNNHRLEGRMHHTLVALALDCDRAVDATSDLEVVLVQQVV